jgi:hypothetical protein
MELTPYVSFAGFAFGVKSSALRHQIGEPLHERTNRAGLTELDYGYAVYRFDDEDELTEITGDADPLRLAGEVIPYAELASFVSAHDPDSFDCYGFVASPKFGSMHDPEHPSWVTALSQRSFGKLRALVA